MIHLALTIDPSHPAFAGHFPFRPIVPGVVLLDESLRAIAMHRGGSMNAEPCRIGNAKFLSTVGPGEAVRLEIESSTGTEADDHYRIRLIAGHNATERVALTGSVTFPLRAVASGTIA